MSYLKQNIEWLKSFISDSFVDNTAGKASSKRVIEVAIVWVFLVAYIKTVLITQSLPDMPWGWCATIMGILGLKVYENVKNANPEQNGTKSSA